MHCTNGESFEPHGGDNYLGTEGSCMEKIKVPNCIIHNSTSSNISDVVNAMCPYV